MWIYEWFIVLRDIKMEKTTVLLGAGAMIPYGGPTTNELTQRLLDNKECNGFFNPIYYRTNENANFEFLLSSIESLLDWKLANEDNNSELLTSNILLEPIYEYKYRSKWDIWKIYKEAINDIIERIKDYDNFISFNIEKYKSLVDYISNEKQKSSIKIYSLNYDRLIPRIASKHGINFYEGIGNNGYEYNLRKFATHPSTFFNLHGSIYTSLVSGDVFKIFDTPIELEYLQKINGGNPGEDKLFLPIIAGYSKSQRIMSEPFNLGIAAFMNDCNTCSRLVIVGYSFGDPYINSILKRFIKFDSTEIIIIDYYEGEHLSDAFRGIPYLVFGIPQAKFIGEGSFLCLDKNHRIKLYLGGIEKYMTEFV